MSLIGGCNKVQHWVLKSNSSAKKTERGKKKMISPKVLRGMTEPHFFCKRLNKMAWFKFPRKKNSIYV